MMPPAPHGVGGIPLCQGVSERLSACVGSRNAGIRCRPLPRSDAPSAPSVALFARGMPPSHTDQASQQDRTHVREPVRGRTTPFEGVRGTRNATIEPCPALASRSDLTPSDAPFARREGRSAGKVYYVD